MTPQELKNSILQLAIQGKLVEQRPEEGNVEEFCLQIQAEKQQRIKSGKIKKEKPLPKILEEEKPFDIPVSWKWFRIGSILNIINGFTPTRSNPEFWNGNIPWFTIDDLREQGRFINFTRQHISKVALSKNTERIIPAGTVLLCCTASIGEYAYTNISLTTNQQFNALVVRNEYKKIIDPMFIFEFAQTLKSSLISKSGKTTFNFLSVGKLAEMLIPLPPPAEQSRIVAKIEELLPYIDRYEKAWSKLEDFNKRFPTDIQKSILQMAIQGKLVKQRPEEGTGEELYQQIQAEKQKLIRAGAIKKEKPLPEISEDEKPFDIPENWKWVRVGNIGSWNAGATPSRTNPQYYKGNVPWLKTGDLNDGYITEVPEYISELALEKTSIQLNPIGSVLMAMYGATIGKLGILCIEATTNQACCACFPLNYMFNKYLFYYLMANRKVFIKMGAGGAQPNISKEKIVNTLMPLPPLAEQKRIVAKLEELLPLCEKLHKVKS